MSTDPGAGTGAGAGTSGGSGPGTSSWTVQVTLTEVDGTTRADAVLEPAAKHEVHGEGVARRHPLDEEDHHIGDELAVARALSDLAHRLLDMAAQDIESHTHRPAALRL
ncbi:MAG TPA: DUF1876 domain-containing protein [Actinomycetales bacterium]|nr:DUF1876 domain-containing protein [Actinomycetales bacterium]